MAIAVELSKISGVRINGEFYPVELGTFYVDALELHSDGVNVYGAGSGFTFYTPSVIPGVKGYTVTGPMSSITAIHTSKK